LPVRPLCHFLAHSLLFIRLVPKPKRAKVDTSTVTDLPASKKPRSLRPPSSRPPVAARVDVVVADLKRDPRCR